MRLFGQPQQKLGAGRVLTYQTRERFFQEVEFALLNQDASKLFAYLCGNAVQRIPNDILPVFRIGGLERFQRPPRRSSIAS